MAPTGKNLESACKAWHHREGIRLQIIAQTAADIACGFEQGTPEWIAAVKEFATADNAVTAHYAA